MIFVEGGKRWKNILKTRVRVYLSRLIFKPASIAVRVRRKMARRPSRELLELMHTLCTRSRVRRETSLAAACLFFSFRYIYVLCVALPPRRPFTLFFILSLYGEYQYLCTAAAAADTLGTHYTASFYARCEKLLFHRITSSGLLVCACVHRDIYLRQASFYAILSHSSLELAPTAYRETEHKKRSYYIR
ncbi:unnamed protein product, partial [Trichogramma brassicae]